MLQPSVDTYVYRLGRRSYIWTNILGWLLLSAFCLVAVGAAIVSMYILPTYAHAFTPYLKWQDALVALCWYIALMAVWGCLLVVRFLFALRAGYTQEMLILSDTVLTVRDLSPENLASIFWLVGTALSCFVAALVGLVPEMLLQWTLHLSHPVLAALCTVLAVLLSVAGLAVVLPALSFVVIGLVGSISFCRKLGSPHPYHLTGQASLSIDGFVLTIIYPDAPEALIDLKLLNADDQRHLLHILREHWVGAQQTWNPQLGEEIEAALAAATVLA